MKKVVKVDIRKQFNQMLSLWIKPGGDVLSVELDKDGEVVLTWKTQEEGLHAYRLKTRLERVDGTEDEVTEAFGPPLDQKEFLEVSEGVVTGCLKVVEVACICLVIVAVITGLAIWRIWG